MAQNKIVTEAQIFLTRECNLACGYCNLVGKKMEELDFEGWRQAFENMKTIGIKTVKILGGEPTVKTWLPELISFSESLGLRTALLSNSSFDDEMFDRLIDAGLYGYYASVDGLSEVNHYDAQTASKARGGFVMLRRMRSAGVPLLAANVVIHRKNYRKIPHLVRRLSDEGFYINLCTVQHNSDGNREFSKASAGEDFRFYPEDRPVLKELAGELITLRQQGVKISIPDRYLAGMEKYGIECNWKCIDMVQLRIDADGGIMLCNEYRTELAEKFNIMHVKSVQDYESLLHNWKRERKELNCFGCYWSCFVQAEENLRTGNLEFSFAGSL